MIGAATILDSGWPRCAERATSAMVKRKPTTPKTTTGRAICGDQTPVAAPLAGVNDAAHGETSLARDGVFDRPDPSGRLSALSALLGRAAGRRVVRLRFEGLGRAQRILRARLVDAGAGGATEEGDENGRQITPRQKGG